MGSQELGFFDKVVFISLQVLGRAGRGLPAGKGEAILVVWMGLLRHFIPRNDVASAPVGCLTATLEFFNLFHHLVESPLE